MEKKVAVIVPVYKVNKSLVTKCIESLLRQTYHNIEIIVVDDGNDEDENYETPGDFLEDVRCLAYTECLVSCNEIAGHSVPLAVLKQHDNDEKH